MPLAPPDSLATVDEIRRGNLRLLAIQHGSKRGLAAAIEKSPAQVSQWINASPDSKTGRPRGMSDDVCRQIEAACRLPRGWMDVAHAEQSPKGGRPHGGTQAGGALDHDLSQVARMIELPTMTWESIMASATELPPRFFLAVPDDALAPDTPRGTVLIFSTEAAPAFGLGVLVADSGGRRYVRRYAEGPGGTWRAQARNDAHATLDSARDGLTVLAVVEGRMTGNV